MGVLRSIEHHNGVIMISHGFSSSKVLTQQPRTRVGRPCSVWRPSMVTSIQHGSLSITGQINAPTITDINNHNPTFHTHSVGSSPIFPPPCLHCSRQPTLVLDSKKPCQQGSVLAITIPLTVLSTLVVRLRRWRVRSRALLGHGPGLSQDECCGREGRRGCALYVSGI